MVTMVTKTWFKTEFKTEVNLNIGLKPNLALLFWFKTLVKTLVLAET